MPAQTEAVVHGTSRTLRPSSTLWRSSTVESKTIDRSSRSSAVSCSGTGKRKKVIKNESEKTPSPPVRQGNAPPPRHDVVMVDPKVPFPGEAICRTAEIDDEYVLFNWHPTWVKATDFHANGVQPPFVWNPPPVPNAYYLDDYIRMLRQEEAVETKQYDARKVEREDSHKPRKRQATEMSSVPKGDCKGCCNGTCGKASLN